MLAGVAGDLGGDPQQVEVLPPHLQEDLALRVELEGFFEGFLAFFVIVFVVVIVCAAVHGVEIVFAHRMGSWRREFLRSRPRVRAAGHGKEVDAN